MTDRKRSSVAIGLAVLGWSRTRNRGTGTVGHGASASSWSRRTDAKGRDPVATKERGRNLGQALQIKTHVGSGCCSSLFDAVLLTSRPERENWRLGIVIVIYDLFATSGGR